MSEEQVCRLVTPPSQRVDASVVIGQQRMRSAWRQARVRAAAAGQKPQLTTVVLDMGGVVIPTLFESVAVRGFPQGPLAHEQEYAAVESGRLQERDYWKRISDRRPDLDIGSLWRQCSAVRQELREALLAIADRYRLAALTNDMAHWFGERWVEDFPELVSFDAIIEVSKLGGPLKPDPAVFEKACQLLSEAPGQCLFVDDLEANLLGASSIGMPTLLFDVRDPLRSVLRLRTRLGIIERQRRSFRAFVTGGGITDPGSAAP